jgi:3-hydroxyacyl-CoA dehydrogenase / enoyl-CoA hydratase / 3-hydroxybutyryl-CoA epimerase
MNYLNWTLTHDSDGIAWATLDKAGSSTNILSANVMAELAQILDELEHDPPKGLVFRSGKSAGFIAGADIEEFARLGNAADARALIERGWHLFNRLAGVPWPTLSLIRGHCMGGGVELSLACRYLVVVDEPSTKLALPEVMLGIFPGWGGMKRLPKRIAPGAALDMMLTGRNIDARKAKRLGLADECVPPRLMDATARNLVLSCRPPKKRPLMDRLMNGLLKPIVAAQAKKQVAARARPEHYPAPYAIIDLWQKHDGNALAAPEIIDRIIGSSTARNLVRIFFLQERLKSFGKETNVPLRRLHVVGAGVMGGDIAAWAAQRGFTVTLQDQSLERIAPALARAGKLFGRTKDKLAQRAAFDRLIPDPTGEGARHADVVIEAIYEDLDAKRRLLADLEKRMRPDAVLATNTSSLRIEDLTTALANPARLVGIHFFNPVARMPLVEVVEAADTDVAVLARACAFVRAIDKLPLPVKSAPGFLVNAVLAPYMLEAMRCVDEGIAPETVDDAMLAFGMPMGPIELADTVGLDIALAAGQLLAGATEAPRCLAERVARGDLGKKSGRGFYTFHDGKAIKGTAGTPPAGLASRLVTPLIERTRALVANGIVADADLAEAGVIFGTGFAPFTGGPLSYQAAKTKEIDLRQ